MYKCAIFNSDVKLPEVKLVFFDPFNCRYTQHRSNNYSNCDYQQELILGRGYMMLYEHF